MPQLPNPSTAKTPDRATLADALVGIMGKAAFVALIEHHGAIRFYVPQNPTENLVACVGENAAEALCGDYGGDYLQLPTARRIRVQLHLERGMKCSDIARHVGMSVVSVRRIESQGKGRTPRPRPAKRRLR